MAPCWGNEAMPSLPEPFVQGDALGLMLTEVHLGHTVINHLITQLAWQEKTNNSALRVPRKEGQTYLTLVVRSSEALRTSFGVSFSCTSALFSLAVAMGGSQGLS